MSITVEPLTPTIGAFVHDVSLADLDDETWKERVRVIQMLEEHTRRREPLGAAD